MTIRDDGRTWAEGRDLPALRDNELSKNHQMAWSLLLFGGGKEAQRRDLTDPEGFEFFMGLHDHRSAELSAGRKERHK